MNSNERMNKHKEKIWAIWNAPQRVCLSENTNNSIDRLLLNHENDSDYKAVMEESFDSSVVISNKPSRKAKMSLTEAKKRLGMKISLHRNIFLRATSAAAIVLIVMSITLTTYINDTPPQVAQVTIQAIDGVQKDVYLTDNSYVWVHQNSKLSFPEEFGNERLVNLEGEAYFEVAKDAERPFIVHTTHLDVKVLGTEFDVAAYPDEATTIVTLFDGAVEVTAGETTNLLSPGEKLTYHHSNGIMEVAKIDISEHSDWRRDAILGHEKTIPQLLAMIANYYDVHIIFDSLAFDDNKRYTVGFSKHEHADKALGVLSELSGSFQFERQNDSIYIKQSP